MKSNYLTKVVQRIASFYPHLRKDLRMAHHPESAYTFVYKSVKKALPLGLGCTVLAFFVMDKANVPLITLIPVLILCTYFWFKFEFIKLRSTIFRRKKEIDREIYFAGQYLLIKLYSGKPLMNALIDTSHSRGVAAKYVKEVVDDIETGSSLEHALNSAMENSPSERFSKILFQVNNALELGIDVTKPLSIVLDEIEREQELEIKRYGRKLNSIVIFYMLAAIVIPSIGMTILIVISSFIQIGIGFSFFALVILFLIILEFIFISVFKSIRPNVNL